MPGRKRKVEDEDILERASNGDLTEVMKWNIVAYSMQFRFPGTKRFRPATIPPILALFQISDKTLRNFEVITWKGFTRMPIQESRQYNESSTYILVDLSINFGSKFLVPYSFVII